MNDRLGSAADGNEGRGARVQFETNLFYFLIFLFVFLLLDLHFGRGYLISHFLLISLGCDSWPHGFKTIVFMRTAVDTWIVTSQGQGEFVVVVYVENKWMVFMVWWSFIVM